VSVVHRPASVTELGELLRSRPGRVRLCGSGSRQTRVADAGAAVRIDLRGLDDIHRLDAPDLTCSVGAGVDRATLDRELHARGVELACAGGGTIGGLFAHDPVGALTIGGGAPRSLLLGLEGMLADGTAFKCGSRVVKSVAGFDVHKLLVGSDGRLFVATRLHLRLVPRPRAEQWFRDDGLDEQAAIDRFVALRAMATPPAALHLARRAGTWTVAGRVAGRSVHVDRVMREHRLGAAEPFRDLHLAPPDGGEVVAGIVLPSRLRSLLANAPANVPFVMHGGGRYEIAFASPRDTDPFLATAATVPTQARLVAGTAERRGRVTALDPGQQRLVDGLKRALDPDGILV